MKVSYHISDVSFVENKMILSVDESEIRIDLSTISEKLLAASDIERTVFKISPSGYGIHWPLIDEDISIKELIDNI